MCRQCYTGSQSKQTLCYANMDWRIDWDPLQDMPNLATLQSILSWSLTLQE
jgi:hypothetical protein